jgi:glycerophosphoryl diester phosphodiesterase
MRVLAHRGASAYAPENTFAAFDLALEMGAAWVETDVRLTRDGVPVLIHDAKVERTTDGHGQIDHLDWADVAKLDAGKWFANGAFAGQRVPRLDRFLHRFMGRVGVCLEIKCLRVIGPLTDELRYLNGHGEVELTSFEWDVLASLRASLPDRPAGWLVRHPEVGTPTLMRAAGAGLAMYCPPVGALTPELVDAARALGLRVRVWGVKSREDLQRVVDCGADGCTLNWPDWKCTPTPTLFAVAS